MYSIFDILGIIKYFYLYSKLNFSDQIKITWIFLTNCTLNVIIPLILVSKTILALARPVRLSMRNNINLPRDFLVLLICFISCFNLYLNLNIQLN